jgi:hypothetical protein
MYLDQTDSNPSNDFLNLPIPSFKSDLLTDVTDVNQRKYFLPYMVFLNTISNKCSFDCELEGMNLVNPLSYYNVKGQDKYFETSGKNGSLFFAPRTNGPFECKCAEHTFPVLVSGKITQCFSCD